MTHRKSGFVIALAIGLLLTACGSETPPAEPKGKMTVSEQTTATPLSNKHDTVEKPVIPQIDPGSGLIIDEGWELVRGHCAACHSARLVTQNRGTRSTWEGMIRWMQETQGLWPLDPVTEDTILDYLARNYAPLAGSRRAPLPPELMPANPYEPKG